MRGLRHGLGAMEWTRAAGALHAGFCGAGIILCREPYPDLTLCGPCEIQFTAISALIAQLPDHHLCQHTHFICCARTVMTEILQAPRAKIIRTSLQHGKTEVKVECLAEVGKIALDELILQVNRVCRNNHPRIILQSEQGGRNKVRKTFPNA